MDGAATRRMLAGVLLLTALWARPAAAECVPGGVDGAAVGRISASALDLVGPLVYGRIPERFEIPETPFRVADCDPPTEGTVITPLETVAQVHLVDVTASFGEGSIELEATLDLQVDGRLDLMICVLPDAVCDAHLTSSAVRVHATVTPSVVDCSASYELTALELTPDPEATEAKLTGCRYEDAWDLVYEWFEESLLEMVAEELVAWVAEEIPPLMESFTADLLADAFEAYGFTIKVGVEDVVVTPEAASVTFAADVRPVGEPHYCLPAGSELPEAVGPVAVEPKSDAMVSLAVSETMVRRAVHSAWLNGMLCFDTRDYDFDLSSPLDFMAPGVQVDGQVWVLSPPEVALTGDEEGSVEVHAEDVRVDASLWVPPHEATVMSATTGFMLQGDIAIDPAYQSLVVGLRDATSTGVLVTAPGTSLSFSGETLESIVRTGLLPVYSDLIRKIPLLSTLFVTAPVAVRMDSVRVAQGQVEADVELWPQDSSDTTPPETVLAAEPPDPAWVDIPIDLASTDDITPSRFLRHMVLVDGEPWEEDPVSGTSLYLWELVHGPHTLSIQAVDLAGNADPTPEIREVFVDDMEPEVRIVGAPTGFTRDSWASMRFEVSDDTSPREALKLRYTLGMPQEDNQLDVLLEEGQLELGEELRFEDLPQGGLVRVTVFARDEAGNEGDGQAVFAANPDPTLGCAAGSRGGVPGRLLPSLLLLGLSLAVLRCVPRRRQ